MKRILYFTFSILLILLGILSAYQMRWISDDAFISLRYAKNLADGKGLVFNVGERVEGYTNFLWTLLLTFPHLTKTIDPVSVTYTLGILSFLGTCIYLLLWNLKEGTQTSLIPFALTCFVSMHHNRVFATGGLETSLHGFLLIASSYHLLSPHPRVTYQGWTIAIVLSALACLNRPDGLLFHGLAGIYMGATFLQDKGASLRKRWYRRKEFLILFFVYFIPALFYIWKLEYYGNLLPNTFYAKSGGSVYLEQGFVYFFLFLKMYYALVPIIAFSVYLFFRKFQEFVRSKSEQKSLDWILLFVFPFLYAGYYTWIGGDFMFARFYLPILPVLFVWVERGITNVPSADFVAMRFRKGVTFLIPLLLLLRFDFYKGTPIPILQDIADENQIYKRETTERTKSFFSPWKEVFETNNVKVAFAGSEAILVYYLNPALAIETEAGLTDPFIARLVSQRRGRIGHEKSTPQSYLKNRGVELLLFTNAQNQTNEYDALTIPDLGITWKILRYSPDMMKELRKIPSLNFVDFEEHLDRYKEKFKNLSPALRKEKYLEFEEYYFANAKDKNRQKWYQKNL
ncbi:hypothetical protein [Leptospira stimsonii]|uniref:Glycosyltransferase RgtA/B/C/D-like domain-containing protein n=1 Tax=Leptospira stimsonii TaxID=2202203 RepID=A0ABY2MYM1_9LEPT|nr:hypothetical protein [Leptospira stimsonii]TGK14380.1 hypothetical protein EHO98_15995 [Leptospira stimsonii]TGM11743.1 hypothetical protein EHQ90_16170 [Leptospira stimsonii]